MPRADLWGAAIFNGEGNHVLHDAHGIPILAKLSPFIAMVLGFAIAYPMSIRKPHLPGPMAAPQPGAVPVPAEQVVFGRDLGVRVCRRPPHGHRPFPLETG